MKRKETKAIIVHHSASPRSSTTLAMIKSWHLARGWDNIGYHYVITADGKIHKTISDDEDVGIQVANFNHVSLGICVTGNFNKEYPTFEQLKSLRGLLKVLIIKYKLRYWNIYGHKDIKKYFIFNTTKTDCPGNALYNMLQYFRKDLYYKGY